MGRKMKCAARGIRSGAAACLIALAALAVAGCTSTPPRETTRPATHAAPRPAGSASVGCADARQVEPGTPTPGPDDLIIGPLTFPGLARGYTFAGPPDPDPDGVTFFKIGAEMAPDSSVTLAVGASARSYAGIVTEHGPSAGYSRVTYTSCAAATGPVWWVGGFSLTGRGSACLPLDMQVAGESAPRHLVLPIETRSCRP